MFQVRFVEGDYFTVCANTVERIGNHYVFKTNGEEVAKYMVSKVVGWNKSEAPNFEDD